MTKNEIKIWTDALRSGKYKQWRGRISNHNGVEADAFCCIGVAYEALIGSCGKKLTDDVCRELGFSWSTRIKLIEWNDGVKFSFKKIADKIEAHPELFD